MSIPLLCNLCATAIPSLTRYSGNTLFGWDQRRAPAMMAHVLNQGRLFGLTPLDWAVLLLGVTLCGAVTSLF